MLSRLLLRKPFSAFNPPFKNTPFTFSSSADPAPVRRDIFWWNSAITGCFRNGEVDSACKLFDEMPHRNLVTWNCMIAGYVQNSRLVDAQSIFDSMPRRNVVSWTALMTGYLQDGRLHEARNLFDEIPEKNVVCWNSMISGYINNGRITEARKLFDRMPSRNTSSWSVMVSGYIRRKQLDEASDLFKQAPFLPTSLYNALLSGLVELGCFEAAEDLFARMDSRDAVSWNSMITCSSRAGKMELAQQLFDDMPEKDVISWTAMIRARLRSGDVERASALFEAMPGRDAVSWNTMMAGFVQNGLLDDALSLFDRMPEKDVVSWNTILQGYVLRNDVAGARRWFESMPRRSETSWNTLISGYQTVEALGLFCEMVREGFKPDRVTLVIAVSICASLVALGWGKMLHLYVIRKGHEHDVSVASSLISMYSRCGFVEDSSRAFEGMPKRDTIAWNAMISAFAYHGFAREAFELYRKMIRSGFRPDHVTFLNLLSACSHKGLIGEGLRCFRSMREEWKLDPRAEHYSCLVDLLGRSGFVVEAYGLTEKVPEGLRRNAWEALLSACGVHGHVEVGEMTARRVLDGRISEGGMLVLLSNIYAAKGKWSESSQIRALMKEHGLKKETGCSWIEVKGEIVCFVSNDRSHPKVEEICRELDCIFLMLEGTT